MQGTRLQGVPGRHVRPAVRARSCAPRRGRAPRQAEAQRDPARARHRLVSAVIDLLGAHRGALRDPVGERRREPRSPTSSRQRLREHAPARSRSTGSAHNVVARTERRRRRPRSCSAATSTPCRPTATQAPRRDGDDAARPRRRRHEGRPRGAARPRRRRSPPTPARRDVTLVFYEGEEVADEHNGLRRLFAERPELVAGDLAILLEPTGGWVEAGCQGTIHVRATFDGARAHSARPWMGDERDPPRRAGARPAAPRYEARRPSTSTASTTAESLQVVRIEGGDRQQRRARPRARSSSTAAIAPRVLARRRGRRGRRAARRRRRGRGRERVAGRAAQPHASARRRADRRRATSPVRPKLGWTDVARFAAHGIAGVQLRSRRSRARAHRGRARRPRPISTAATRVLGRFLGVVADARLRAGAARVTTLP